MIPISAICHIPWHHHLQRVAQESRLKGQMYTGPMHVWPYRPMRIEYLKMPICRCRAMTRPMPILKLNPKLEIGQRPSPKEGRRRGRIDMGRPKLSPDWLHSDHLIPVSDRDRQRQRQKKTTNISRASPPAY